MSSTAIPITLTVRLESVIDPQRARRIAQLLFTGSTGVTVAASTGVAS
jgi:hypothetical protein